jgi:hypothetical protein
LALAGRDRGLVSGLINILSNTTCKSGYGCPRAVLRAGRRGMEPAPYTANGVPCRAGPPRPAVTVDAGRSPFCARDGAGWNPRPTRRTGSRVGRGLRAPGPGLTPPGHLISTHHGRHGHVLPRRLARSGRVAELDVARVRRCAGVRRFVARMGQRAISDRAGSELK